MEHADFPSSNNDQSACVLLNSQVVYAREQLAYLSRQ